MMATSVAQRLLAFKGSNNGSFHKFIYFFMDVFLCLPLAGRNGNTAARFHASTGIFDPKEKK